MEDYNIDGEYVEIVMPDCDEKDKRKVEPHPFLISLLVPALMILYTLSIESNFEVFMRVYESNIINIVYAFLTYAIMFVLAFGTVFIVIALEDTFCMIFNRTFVSWVGNLMHVFFAIVVSWIYLKVFIFIEMYNQSLGI